MIMRPRETDHLSWEAPALTVVRARSYDGPVLSITVPGRRVHLADVRHSTPAIYGAAVRTPLVRVDLSDAAGSPSELYLTLEVLQPIGSGVLRRMGVRQSRPRSFREERPS